MAQQYHPDKNPKGREMFEKVNNAYEFLCSRSAKSSDTPDANNIVLVLRTQSILFCRYSTELHPYKYAGYPMLIKTIQLETDDEKLFSKSGKNNHFDHSHWGKNSHCQIIIFDKIHIFKFSFLTKFTFQIPFFDKIHNFEFSYLTKITNSQFHF